VVLALVCLAATGPAIIAQEPNLTEDQIREFLLKAKIVDSHRIDKGVTSPWRLTLTDGRLRHDAAFQSIDEFIPLAQMPDGTTESGFRDSYRYNIAAFELAKLVGLGEMMPVYVERSWRGTRGSLSWWLPVKMDEKERVNRKLEPPDLNAWHMQVNRMWVFSELVYDTDRNRTNMLIDENWKLWMIDFSRAFLLRHKLHNPSPLAMCDRQLLEKLQQLDEAVVREKTKPYLTKEQVKAVMARRDLIVAYFEKQIAEKGEKAVLY
jgi:hypothetical protein